MADRRVVRSRPMRYRSGGFVSREDSLAGEEPLEIRIGGRAFSVTMRTPGEDIELLHGFLHGEGIITDREDIQAIRYCDGVDESGRNTYNVLDVTLRDGIPDPVPQRSRATTTTSACGVCGSASLETVQSQTRFQLTGQPVIDPQVILDLPRALREHQQLFARTGGIHGAALADAQGQILISREDVGRHNAVDKVIGAALMKATLGTGRALDHYALVTSSRASFELVQKAAVAGIGMLIAVSAASSLAVDLARSVGMTLIGFLRDDSFNIYSHPERVAGATGPAGA